MMLFEWMARAAVLAALIGVAAWALEEVLRGSKRATRFVWFGALLVSILLPTITLVAPDVWPESLKHFGGVIVLPTSQPEIGELVQAATEPAVRRTWSARDFALGLWFSASMLLALRWLHGWQKLREVRVRWSEAVLAGERVLISDQLGPAVVGLRRPRVVIPSWLLLGDAERQRMIVRHEVEHTRAGDQWLLALSPLLVALFPWNPALWWQLQRLRIAIELDCDARVLRGGVPALEYGSMLLDIAGSTTVLQATLAALSEPRTSLERRIRAMTPTRYRYALARAASFAALSVLTLVGAVIAGAPTAPPVVAQEQRTPLTQQQQQGNLLIVLDGKLLAPTAKLNLMDLSVQSVDVLQPADAVKRFGPRGRFGAVVVTTKPRIDVPQLNAAAEMVVGELKGELRGRIGAAPVLTGPTGMITGQVLIGETGDPAVNAQVFVGNRGAVTNADGRFVIHDVPVGQRRIDVRMPGHIGQQEVVVAVDASAIVPTIRLAPMTDLQRAKFEKAVSVDIAVADVVKSAAATRPLIFIDGVAADNDVMSRLDPAMIDRIEVVKGAAAARLYGDSGANGVIQIFLKKR